MKERCPLERICNDSYLNTIPNTMCPMKEAMARQELTPDVAKLIETTILSHLIYEADKRRER